MNGILPLWKEPGMTSHDCVFKVRKILKTKKVGHTGTLDPDVDGVLPICIGRATKIAEYITEAGKSYRAQIVIGESTETEDASGKVIEKKTVDQPFTLEQLQKAAVQLRGDIEQTPPMYSAVKVNGKRLYEYAREGKVIERPSRVVRINEIAIDESSLHFDESNHTFMFEADISCGKGTYIRTLAVMIGEYLGYPGHMSKLTRTSSAQFTASDCVTLEELAALSDQQAVLKPMELGLSGLKKISVSDTVASKVKHGAVLPVTPDWPAEMGEPVAVFDQQKVLAIYHLHPEKAGMMKPVKVIWTG
ncbi:tRNA pseudouridine(55) synthase TruB [Jeotgalibacillus haloalkalitolerans]|uniref:tRNA pseudouridine synthase B n=1 Tax=Jeotgalibacillus haloalkalitolerans TaxID=3104292 RepID=A0ABU5KM29_9BACL|nr:tRNA pseudouridine(55) synthase TruB [Jeotgalibacillus sp. HH7-29]MDZ5711765.1 tRNA pseudouridine(55) synthase TruB [Jeotgalibacillus sp. HH7-29]